MSNNFIKYRRWTFASRECYGRGCICSENCSNHDICKKFLEKNCRPPMKQTVLNLVRLYGIPVITEDNAYGF